MSRADWYVDIGAGKWEHIPPHCLPAGGWWFDLSHSKFRKQAKGKVLRANTLSQIAEVTLAPSSGGGRRESGRLIFLSFK